MDMIEAMAIVRDGLIAAAQLHERSGHGGAPCWDTRAGMIAYLCHAIGVRGPHLKRVTRELAGYDATCRDPSCRHGPPLPKVVCLCGSARFWREYLRASLRETLAGNIVLSIGAAAGTDDEHFGNLPRAEFESVKSRLDELHLRKIDLADEVLVLNVGGYVGESTRREVAYAQAQGKTVRWLEPF